MDQIKRVTNSQTSFEYSSATALDSAISTFIQPTDVVMDIGCGIMPQNFFRPKLNFLVEPWHEYSSILAERFKEDKSVIILRTDGLSAAKLLSDRSVDTVFLLDVIEHMEKAIGLALINELKRIARVQIVLFTPNGFMPQEVHGDEKDAWGLGGNSVQEHKSGWLPEDLGHEWQVHLCGGYHTHDFRGRSLPSPYGAFYAIWNRSESQQPEKRQVNMVDLRKPLPSEIRCAELESTNNFLKAEIGEIENARALLAAQLGIIASKPLVRLLRKLRLLDF